MLGKSFRSRVAVSTVILTGSLVGILLNQSAAADPTPRSPGIVTHEFVYESAPFPSCHASTIADTPAGLVTAWFGGEYEKHPQVGIWVSLHREGKWSVPVEVATGKSPDGQQYPTWNPVLIAHPKDQLTLYYKVGPDPETWWGMRLISQDHGATWGAPERLPDGIYGPIKNKPIILPSGELLSGTSTEDHGWRVFMELADAHGQNPRSIGPLNDGKEFGAIQPCILQHGHGKLQILCRSRQGMITQAWSTDHGKTWGPMTATTLPNPNSGIDAVTLRDGRHALIYNHTRKGRSPLNLAISKDGIHWEAAAVLESEPGEYSYPAIIETADQQWHVTYTWQRKRVRHVVLDPAKLVFKPIVAGSWPE